MSRYKNLALLIVLVLVPTSMALAQTTGSGFDANNTVWANIVNTKGVVNVWKVALGLIDLIVIGGLLVSAFANIFRFKIDTYAIKSILPGLIIGIVLANLSYFIMRLFLESATILTQFLGNIVAPYTGGTIDNLHVGQFLVSSMTSELLRSLFFTPDGWAKAIGVVTAGAANAGLAVFTIPALTGAAAVGSSVLIGAGVFLLALFLLVVLLPLILFLILIFLLYIRSYVLILCFMTAPIAFFALGFPPMKSFWTKWWGFFWKWLLMPLASFSIIALAIIFLHAVNNGNGGQRNALDYLFVNGVAIALLFLANRIPFMWGSFFGYNVMGQWGKAGATGADSTYRGAKWLGDRRQTSKATRAFDLARAGAGGADVAHTVASLAALPTAALDARGSALRLPRRAGETDAAYAVRVAAQYQVARARDLASAQSARRRRNVVRRPQAMVEGFKERQKQWDAAEGRALKQNEGYGQGGGQEVRDRGGLQRHKEDKAEIEDERVLWGEFSELANHYETVGGNREDVQRFLSMGDTGFITEMNTNPYLQELMRRNLLSRDGVVERQRSGKRLQQLARPNNFRRNVPGTPQFSGTKAELIRGLLNGTVNPPHATVGGGSNGANGNTGSNGPNPNAGPNTGGNGTPNPGGGGTPNPSGGTSGGGSGPSPSGGAGGSSGGGAGSTDPTHDAELLDALDQAGKGAIADHAKEIIKTLPHAAITAATQAYQDSQRALSEELRNQGVGEKQGKALIHDLIRRVHRGVRNISLQEIEGMAGREGLDHAKLDPIMAQFTHNRRALQESTELAIPERAEAVPIQAQVALHLANADPSQIRTQLKTQIAQLQIPDVATNVGELKKIHATVAELAADVRPIDTEATAATISQRINENKSKLEGALRFLEQPDVVAARSQNDPVQLRQAVDIASQQRMLLQHGIVEGAKDLDAQSPQAVEAMASRMHSAIVEYSPTIKEAYDNSDEGQRQSVENLIATKSQELAQTLQEQAQAKGLTTHSYLNDPETDGKNHAIEWVENEVAQGVSSLLSRNAESTQRVEVPPAETQPAPSEIQTVPESTVPLDQPIQG